MGSSKIPVTQQFESHSCAAGEQMGPVLLPGMNSVDLRIFHYEQPFYNIFKQRRQQFCFGQRPEDLLDVQTINQCIWVKHQTYLQRLKNFPLLKAVYEGGARKGLHQEIELINGFSETKLKKL